MTSSTDAHAVTGPFSYTGKYIAKRLQQEGTEIRGLVRHLDKPRKNGIDCRKLQFTSINALVEDLRGVRVLHNTYWIRLERSGETFARAVRNTAVLVEAARRAGVERVVHLSVSNPSRSSPFAYFRGKAEAEAVVIASGSPYSIIRPTLVFGQEDILINNIAWLLRKLHVFAVPGSGMYRVQPVFVEDVAKLAVQESHQAGSRCLDAAGPEIIPFGVFVRVLRWATGSRSVIARLPMGVTTKLGQLLGIFLRDTLITYEELGALMAETLVSSRPPTADTKISEWLDEAGPRLGATYHSELSRHWPGDFRPLKA